MSSNTKVQLDLGNFPNGYCWPGSPQQYGADLVAILTAFLPGQYNTFNFGPNTPSVDDQDKPWIKTDNSGFLIGLFTFAGGSWCRPNPVPASGGGRMVWVGSEADLWAYDGGDGTNPTSSPPTATTGAMWQRDTAFDFRFPVGIGTNATVYDGGAAKVINPGDTGGEERHTLVDNELVHTHKLANGDTVDISNHLDASTKKYLATHGDSTTSAATEYNLTGSGTDPTLGLTGPNGAASADTTASHQNLPPYLGVIFAKRTARTFYTS